MYKVIFLKTLNKNTFDIIIISIFSHKCKIILYSYEDKQIVSLWILILVSEYIL